MKKYIRNDEENINNSNDKMLNVIDCIFEDREISFIDITKKLNIPKSTLNRILSSLVKSEFIEKNQTNEKYRLGFKFIYYSETIKSKLSIVNITEGIIKDLAKSTGETVNLGILYNDYVLNILSVKGEESALTSILIPMSPLNCSATGKIFLAYKNDLEQKEYFKNNHYEKRTIKTICTFEDFKKEQNQILKTAISCDNEEYEYGLFCIASPLKNHTGIINAAISITGPKVRMEIKGIDYIKKELSEKVTLVNEILIKIKFNLTY